MAMLPQILFNMALAVGGVSLRGDVPSFTLPKLKIKTEGYRTGGMDAEIDMDMGLEKLESSFVTYGIRKEVMKYVGLMDGEGTTAVFRGSFANSDKSTVGVIVTTRGRIVEWDPGDWKPGEKAENKYAYSLTYYKLEIDGAVMYEIDPINMVRIVDGVDQLAEHRTNLGF